MKRSFRGRCDVHQRLVMKPDQKRGYEMAIAELQGKDIRITVDEWKPQRSLDQNAYLHAVVFPPIAEYMGEDIEGAKLVLMGECWGWKRDEMTGREIPVKPHTSSMTVEECTYFIEWVLPWAVEHCDGLQVPLPNEWIPAGAAR